MLRSKKMMEKTVNKAREIKRVSTLDWQESLAQGAHANRINKSQTIRNLIANAGVLGMTKKSLQIETGWDLHNLQSVLRESFCDKYAIEFDKEFSIYRSIA